jgi:hypothetical protein
MMEKEIMVLFSTNNVQEDIKVAYRIDVIDDVQVISCKVMEAAFSAMHWLQLRTFSLKSSVCKGEYTPLYTDNPGVKNIAASDFIDRAYVEIMAQEHCTILN